MILQLSKDTIGSVVSLHEQVLGHTLNSRLGPWFLRKLYRTTSDAVGNGYCFVFMEHSEVLGFISVCLDYAKLQDDIMASVSLSERIAIVLGLAYRPSLWLTFLRQRAFGRYLGRTFTQPYASILTLGVSPSVQGRGIGRQLVEQAKSILRAAGRHEFFVDTEETNIGAVSFYEKNEFKRATVKYGNIVLRCPL